MASKRETLIASAEKALTKGKPEAALKDYQKVLEETPNDINILNKVGDLCVRLNRNEDSLPYFLKIAEHYSKDGFFLKAIAIYKKINKLDPARLDVYERLAELYSKQGLGMEAKSQYQVLADYYTKQDNIAGAISIYQKMMAAEPSNIQLHVKLADLYTQAKRVPDALKEYAVVAQMLRERNAIEESIQVYEKALKIAPDNVEILKTFVPLLLEANRADQAREALRRALETTPRSIPLFVLAAEAALTANDMAEARSYAAKAQAVDPENEEVLTAVVRVQLKGRRPDLAFSAAGPLADQLVRRGEGKRALGVLAPVAKAAPDNEDILKKVVEIAISAGDEVGAVPYRAALADLWKKAGKVVEAAEALRACIRVSPDVSDYRAKLLALEPLLPAPAAKKVEKAPDPAELSFPGVKPTARPPAPPQPKVLPGRPAPAPTSSSADEFEFELPDDELEEVEEAPPSVATPLPATRGGASAGVKPVLPPPPPILPTPPPPPAFGYRGGPVPDAIDVPTDFGRPMTSAPPPGAGGAPVVPAGLTPPRGVTPLQAAAEEIEEITEVEEAEPIEEIEEIVELPPTAEEYAAAPPALAGPPVPPPDPEVEEALVEADVFRRYGLLEKAIEHLKNLTRKRPESLKAREKLFEIYLEQGKKALARREAEVLRDGYRLEGREDRIKALEALLGEPLPEATDVDLESPTVLPQAPPPYSPPAPEPEPVKVAPEPPKPVVSPPLERPAEKPAPPAIVAPPPRPVAPPVVAPIPPAAVAPVPTVTPMAAASTPLTESRRDSTAAAPEPAGTPPAVTPPPVARPKVDLTSLVPTAPPAKPKAVKPSDIDLDLGMAPKAAPKPKAVPTPIDLDLGLLGKEPAKEKKKSVTAGPDLSFLDRPKPAIKPKPVEPAPPSLDIAAKPTAPSAPAAAPHAETPLDLALTTGDIEMLSAQGHAGQDVGEAAEPEVPAPVEQAPELAPPVVVGPTAEELGKLDFCLEQGMVVDAAELLHTLEARFPNDGELLARRMRLEGRSPGGEERPSGPSLDIFGDDLDTVLDAQLGRALTDEMARGGGAMPHPHHKPAPDLMAPVDESGLFSDEAEFFNFADELQTEMKSEMPAGPTGEVSLEEIFREFKKGVEQQLSPEDFETHYNLGIAYKEMALVDEAIGEFQLAAKSPTHAVECCSMLGLCFLEKGMPQLAIKWYKKGLETSGIKEDDRLGLLYDLGNVYAEVGDRESAYKTFLEIYGANAAYRDVGDRLRELGN